MFSIRNDMKGTLFIDTYMNSIYPFSEFSAVERYMSFHNSS